MDFLSVFHKFKSDIIQGKEDTKNSSWQKLSQKLEEIVGTSGFEINLLSPRDCIIKAVEDGIPKRYQNLIEYLDSIENAFYCLSLFALNLCRKPKNPVYHLIKTYTGFYTCNIASVLNGYDIPILQSMGFIVTTRDHEDEFSLDHVNRNIEQIAFQLLLAQLYCRRVKTIVHTVNANNYPDSIAAELFEHLDKPLFNMDFILDFCEIKQKDESRKKKQNVQQTTLLRNDLKEYDRHSHGHNHNFQNSPEKLVNTRSRLQEPIPAEKKNRSIPMETLDDTDYKSIKYPQSQAYMNDQHNLDYPNNPIFFNNNAEDSLGSKFGKAPQIMNKPSSLVEDTNVDDDDLYGGSNLISSDISESFQKVKIISGITPGGHLDRTQRSSLTEDPRRASHYEKIAKVDTKVDDPAYMSIRYNPNRSHQQEHHSQLPPHSGKYNALNRTSADTKARSNSGDMYDTLNRVNANTTMPRSETYASHQQQSSASRFKSDELPHHPGYSAKRSHND